MQVIPWIRISRLSFPFLTILLADELVGVFYNEEDAQHLSVMTVYRTLEFALLNNTKEWEKGSIPVLVIALLKMFGISRCGTY